MSSSGTIAEWQAFIYDILRKNNIFFVIETVGGCFNKRNFERFYFDPSTNTIALCPVVDATFADCHEIFSNGCFDVQARATRSVLIYNIEDDDSGVPFFLCPNGSQLTETFLKAHPECISLLP